MIRFVHINDMTSGIEHEHLDLQISLAHIGADLPPTVSCQTVLIYPLFLSCSPHQHLKYKTQIRFYFPFKATYIFDSMLLKILRWPDELLWSDLIKHRET